MVVALSVNSNDVVDVLPDFPGFRDNFLSTRLKLARSDDCACRKVAGRHVEMSPLNKCSGKLRKAHDDGD